MRSLRLAALKYGETARVAFRSRTAYLWDQILSTLFLVTVLYVLYRLWKTTFASAGESGEISGYSFPEMIWYLVATEAIILSLPRVQFTIEQEVRDGELAVRLNKPYVYLLFHYSSAIGEAIVRLFTVGAVGAVTAYLLVGPIDVHPGAIPALVVLYFTTQALHFCYNATIGLSAFWTEDVSGLYFIFDRMKWILGGFLMPLEVFPDRLRPVVEALPFRHMIYGPAKLFIDFSWPGAGQLLLVQLGWLVVFAAACAGVYALGVRRIDLNGG